MLVEQSVIRQVIAEERDEFGVIRVVESGKYRYLEFGEGAEQSCVLYDNPLWLKYDYTRAMVLASYCHPYPETALFLGLGAGTLTQICLAALPLQDVEILELREPLPRLAMEHLGMRDDQRMTIRIGDALELIDTAETADLIYLDMYTDLGPSVGHLAWSFLSKCQDKLNLGGWLIINQWATLDGKPLGAALLRGMFYRHYWEIPVKEGNVILLVPSSFSQSPPFALLREQARMFEAEFGYDISYLIDQIRSASV
ncbi:spermidine synthase [Denitrificimonas sp. JX-1]|uniref:Spermidine synthase n=1 Tax=Denitrificimonas halotolerans TaxID=3098930 RepID=A0ABU5GPD1_9GAMM|nr:spermidine synthase [Denitrificimonas sp. JX-1]MDY7218859.1 spermidine synthase [Denitrificimonas sp. JX-1]